MYRCPPLNVILGSVLHRNGQTDLVYCIEFVTGAYHAVRLPSRMIFGNKDTEPKDGSVTLSTALTLFDRLSLFLKLPYALKIPQLVRQCCCIKIKLLTGTVPRTIILHISI